MQRPTFSASVVWLVAALAVVIVGELLTPLRALGSCGDYVTMTPHGNGSVQLTQPAFAVFDFGIAREQAPANLVGLQTAAKAGLESPRGAHAVPCSRCPHGGGAPAKLPCRGPWCDGGRSPMPPPSTPVDRSHDQWALCLGLQRPGDSDPMPHGLLQDNAHRIHHVSPRFHPPRPV
jgi:hypothetical protein